MNIGWRAYLITIGICSFFFWFIQQLLSAPQTSSYSSPAFAAAAAALPSAYDAADAPLPTKAWTSIYACVEVLFIKYWSSRKRLNFSSAYYFIFKTALHVAKNISL